MDTPLNLAAGGTAGFIFRQWAESEKRKHEITMSIADKREDSMENASKRGGTWVRRILVVAVVIGMLMAVFSALLGHDVVLESELNRKFLFWEWERVKYVTVNGVVILKENRSAFEQLIGFYFGQAIK